MRYSSINISRRLTRDKHFEEFRGHAGKVEINWTNLKCSRDRLYRWLQTRRYVNLFAVEWNDEERFKKSVFFFCAKSLPFVTRNWERNRPYAYLSSFFTLISTHGTYGKFWNAIHAVRRYNLGSKILFLFFLHVDSRSTLLELSIERLLFILGANVALSEIITIRLYRTMVRYKKERN